MYKNYNKIVRIDTIVGIDLDTVTLPDICWKYGTGVAISTGDKRVGTYKSDYRCGVMIDMGDIQRDIWRQVAEHIARHDGQEWPVKALPPYAPEYSPAKYLNHTLKISVHLGQLPYTSQDISHKIQSFIQKLQHYPCAVSNFFLHPFASYLFPQR